MTDAGEFQRESYRIDEKIWNALALSTGERALFLGVANDGAWIERAVQIGLDVTVVTSDHDTIALVEKLGATPMRGSATMIAATENAFDVAIAMHYLHEIDPGFHSQVIGEMARVGRRAAIVEPSPPADPLGKRIAALYARAKRESGQFEGYQTIDYWRKLLASVKADVWQNLFTFTRVPSREAVAETISLVLNAMVIEAMPRKYLDELRELAARRDAQLLPLSRIVLVGIGSGQSLPQGSGSAFRPNIVLGPEPPASSRLPAGIAPAAPAAVPRAPSPAPPSTPPASFGFAPDEPPTPGAGWGAPPPEAPSPAAVAPRVPASKGPPPKPAPAPPATPAGSPFGAPFALPEDEPPFGKDAEEKTGFGWSWEPPEEEEPTP
jgi:hypothetical protein